MSALSDAFENLADSYDMKADRLEEGGRLIDALQLSLFAEAIRKVLRNTPE